VYYPFDDVVVHNCKILDKNLYYIGNDNLKADKMITYIDPDPKKEKFISYLFNENKLTSIIIYGYKRYHIFIREAMRMALLPDYNFVLKFKDKVHLFITQEVLKQSDKIECFRDRAIVETTKIDTRKYSIEDQQYIDDLMKRGLSAYNELKKKYKEERKKNENEGKASENEQVK
jgi:hypothetical protein